MYVMIISDENDSFIKCTDKKKEDIKIIFDF